MSTKVEKRILVNVPLSVAYNQWTQFEEFPHFMGGVKSVTQLDEERLNWVVEIGGIRRQWDARILEQVPDTRVSWAATEGATNAGSVSFEDVGGGQTQVHLVLEYEPEGLVEKIGDKLNVVENQAEGDLERFKAFIEDEGYATGAWRGSVGTGTTSGEPGVEAAASSRGDSGKAGVSGKVAAGIGLAAAAAVAGVAAGGRKNTEDTEDLADVTITPAGDGAPEVYTDAEDALSPSARETLLPAHKADPSATGPGTGTGEAGGTGDVLDDPLIDRNRPTGGAL
jgi:carbon monoxide dehydrogenase subunit G